MAEWYGRFSRCDDGCVAEALDHRLTRMLARDWPSVIELEDLSAQQPPFKRFVVKHLGGDADPKELRKVRANAVGSCPAGRQDFCREISAALARASSSSKTAVASAPYKVDGIHAYLFYESLGKLDERDLLRDKVVLWNTIIGEGDARAPSNTTLVVIDVVGPSFLAGTKGTLSVTAKEGKRVLRREAVQLESFFSEGTKLSIPFVVVGAGCGTLKVEVDLSVKGKQDRLSRTVEYPCGE